MLLTHSTIDDTIPYSVGKQLDKDWCGKGTNVRWSPNAAPLQVSGMIPNTIEALPWFEARFAAAQTSPRTARRRVSRPTPPMSSARRW